MKKFIKNAVIVITIICGSAVVLTGSSSIIYAAPSDNANEVCEGVAATGGDCDSGDTINDVVTVIVDIFSWVVGVVAVIMIIWAGFTYVTAAGDPQKASKARSTILYAVIGLVVVALSQLIVRFVVTEATTQTQTQTTSPSPTINHLNRH